MGMQRFDHEDDERFDEPTQQQIFQLAAELQKEEAASLSRTQMEEIAAEAGIDPRFVRRAVERLNTNRKTQPVQVPSSVVPLVALAVLIMVNVYGASGTLSGTNPYFYLIFGYSLVVGALASRNLRQRLLTYSVALVSVLLVYGWCVFIHRVGMGPAIEDNVGFLRNYVGVQMLAILFGQGLAALVRLSEKYLSLNKGKATS
jgi:hypothetical protein